MIVKILQYFQPWDFTRWFRLVAALFLFAAGAVEMQFLPVLIGGIFFYQAITNTGCCAGRTCQVPQSPSKKIKD